MTFYGKKEDLFVIGSVFGWNLRIVGEKMKQDER